MRQTAWKWIGSFSALVLIAGGLTVGLAQPAAAAEPVLISGPTISGVAQVGQVLTATDAAWNHDGFRMDPTDKVWLRCGSNDDAELSSCERIYYDDKYHSAWSSTTYRLSTADLGKYLRRFNQYTVTYPFSYQNVWSAATAMVTATPASKPVNKVLPKIQGKAKVHTKLTVSTGTWTGTAPMTFKYQWKNCNAKAKSCKTIPRATTASFTPGHKYRAKRLTVVVTAINSVGTRSVTSKATSKIKK